VTHQENILNPDDYTIVPHVAVLDEFRLTNANGTFVADITPAFLDALVAHMTEREQLTGDLCPLVVGHTQDGEREIDSPPLIGFARNWHRGILGETGRQAAFVDCWIRNDMVEVAKNYPRRSSEVWVSRNEIDPISFLGATTPCRDLGLLKLSRNGSFTYETPGDKMAFPDKIDKPADDKSGKPAPDAKNTGDAKGLEGKLDQILAALTQLLQSGPAAPGGAAPGAAPAAPGAPAGGAGGAGGGDQMSDAEFEQLMAELGQGGGAGAGAGGGADDGRGKAGEKPVQAEEPKTDDKVRMSRIEAELAETRAKLSRTEVREALSQIRAAGRDVDPNDEALVADLIAQPPDMRLRSLDRLAKLSRPTIGTGGHLGQALDHATGGDKKRMTREDAQRLTKLALSRKQSFDQVAAEEGFAF
jgi:hypothetical protein